MKKLWIIVLTIASGCATRDSGCGATSSEGAEAAIMRRYKVDVTCLLDDADGQYLCADEKNNKLYRCAESAAAQDKIKCIPWFPTE
jgi:hypothetical protein